MTDTQPIQAPEGRDAWRTALEGSKTRDVEFTDLGDALEPLYGPETSRAPSRTVGYPGQFPTPRVHLTIPRAPLDDAPVRGVRDRARDERALQVPPRAARPGSRSRSTS